MVSVPLLEDASSWTWRGELQLPQRRLLARWGGTAGVVNQAAAVQGPATSQHQGLTSPLTA